MNLKKNLSWPILAAAIAVASACHATTGIAPQVNDTAVEKTETATAPKADDEFQLLTIGSKAPSLDIEHWISNGNGAFNKVTSLESGKVYVVEFWATWCGPCIGSMPHLVETQKKFGDKGVQIISVSDEDLDTVNGFLATEFPGAGENGPKTYGELTSAYCLTCDPDSSVEKDYFLAAAQNGIPCCFIVGKTGLIEWLGHPMEMEEPLQAVVDGTWDRETVAGPIRTGQEAALLETQLMTLMEDGDIDAALALIAKTRASSAGNAERLEMLDAMEFQIKATPALEKLQAGDMAGGLKMLEELAATAPASQKPQICMIRLSIAMQQGNFDAASKVLVEMASLEKAEPEMLNQIAWTIFEMSQSDTAFSKPLLDAATTAAEKAVSLSPTDGSILDTFAHLLHKQGHLDRAIEVQTKALENPGPLEAELRAFLEQLKKEKDGK